MRQDLFLFSLLLILENLLQFLLVFLQQEELSLNYLLSLLALRVFEERGEVGLGVVID